MKPIDETPTPSPAKRLNITETEAIKKKARDTKLRNKQGSLTFAQQKTEIERANSILLSRVINRIDTMDGDPEQLLQLLQKCAQITKAMLVEDRNAEVDPTKLTDEQLQKAARG